ncbi:MAG: SDR family NAD(P)-dependent oxidoreductase [Solirubrobacteraceae bacterium]|nr:SDR family NAD(P)-dependent oxidoreductase [Solirubrobacteraceae bacterium]
MTGASSGIGEATALHLAGLGYRVLAGVRSTADFERLRATSPGIEPVMLDITNEDHIATLVEFVERSAPGGLAGLVNNAGIASVGPIEMLSLDEWRAVMDTNVIGTVAITTALLPLLFEARGRIVNISSGAGRIAFPLFGPYASSKFAIEAFSDVLRREIGEHGVDVVCVEPGVVSSSIFDKNLAASYARAEQQSEAQAGRYRGLFDSAHRSAEEAGAGGAAAPDTVAPVVAKVLAARRPKARYAVGWDSRTAAICARFLPDRLIDLVIRRLTSS